MTAVRLGESARYGLRLYAYVLGITLVGGAGVGLGAALAWPEVAAWRGPGQAEVVPGVAGGILLFLGLSVLAIGYLATAYKLVADGVAAGRAGSAPTEEPADVVEEEPEPAAPAPADPNVGDAGPAEATAGSSETTEVGSMAAEESAPPEPSPEEIAFGSSSDEASEGSSSADETGGSANPGSLPGQNAASDPLADPSEE